MKEEGKREKREKKERGRGRGGGGGEGEREGKDYGSGRKEYLWKILVNNIIDSGPIFLAPPLAFLLVSDCVCVYMHFSQQQN